MYNNFLSKKSKKAISALLASALVITAAPISADAATNKIVGVGKSTTVSVSAKAKVSGLSKAEKKVVKVTKKGKKFTIKGLKAGKASFKIGKKAFNVKVGATSIKKKSFATSLTVGSNKNVTVNAVNGKADTLTWKSSNTKIVKVSKASSKASSKKVASNTLKPVKAGKANITVTSKNTGRKLTVKVTVKAKVTPTKAPVATSQAPAATTNAPQPTQTASGPAATTEAPQPTQTASGPAATTEAPQPTQTASGPAATTEAPQPTQTAPVQTQVPSTVSAEAVSAAAVNVKTIAITFNRDLTKDEQNAIVVDVTKENATQSVKKAFKTDNTLYITRDTDLAFTSGTYKVVLSGTVAYTQNVEVQAQKATKLDVTSVVLEDGKEKAAVKVSLKDQYGEEMDYTDADFTTKTYVNQTQSGTRTNLQFADKTFYIDTKTNADAYKINDIINVVLLHKSGLSATASLKVVEATYVNDIKLGDYVLPLGTTRLTEDVKNVDIPYTATNNYGEVVDLTSNDYSIVSTETSVLDSSVITLYKDSNNKTYFRIGAFAGAGKTTLIVMNNKNGQTAKIDLDVQEKAGKPYAIQLEKSSAEVAQGSTAYVALTVTDKYGDKVAAKDLVGDNALVLASSNTSALANDKLDVVKDETNANYGKLSIDANGATANSTVVVTITLPNGTNTTLQVKIGNPAVPTTLQAKANENVLVAGGTTTIKAIVNDQYSSEVTNLGDYSVEANDLDKNGVITVATTGAVKEFTVTGQKAGTARVKVDLKAKDGKIVDTKTVNITVEANTTANLAYSTKEIPTLYKNTSSTDVNSAADYAKEVVITGKKADGTTLTLPASKILSVTSDNEVVQAAIKDGKWYVFGKDNSTKPIEADVTAKLTIVVATDDGSTIVNQNVTVSKDAVKTVAIKLYDKVSSADDKKELTSVSVNKYGDAITFNTGSQYLYTVDQFGVAHDLASADAVSLSSFNKIEGANASVATYTDSSLTMTNKVGTAQAGASYKVTLVKDGAAFTFTVNVINADNSTPAPGTSTTPSTTPSTTTPAALAVTSSSAVSGAATVDVTLEFNEEVATNKITNVVITGTAVSASAVGNVSVTPSMTQNGKSIKMSISAIKDLQFKEGNLKVMFNLDGKATEVTVQIK